MEVRLIVAGGRDFTNKQVLTAALDAIIPELFETTGLDRLRIISGNARGADKCGEDYAIDNSIPLFMFPADWNMYGKRAGYIRNVKMAEFAKADGNIGALVAFWDGKSKGTKHMIDIARERGLTVYVFSY